MLIVRQLLYKVSFGANIYAFFLTLSVEIMVANELIYLEYNKSKIK